MSNKVIKVFVHMPTTNSSIRNFYKKISEFHFEIIKDYINNLNATSDFKIKIIDELIRNFESRELNGIIYQNIADKNKN